MIIENGSIRIQRSDGGGIDTSTGYPMAAVQSWGAPVPCQFVQRSFNALARQETEPVTRRSYDIYVEFGPELHPMDRIRLSTCAGITIGEFSVIAVEPLQAVEQVRISV